MHQSDTDPGVSMRVPTEVVADRIVYQQTMGWTSIAMGSLIAITGPDVGDRVRWFAALAGWPVTPGILFVVSGALILAGLTFRNARSSLSGFVLGAVLYLAFAVGFVLQWRVFVLDPVGDPPFVYPVAIYGGAAVLHAVSADSLIRQRRKAHAARRGLP